MDRKKFFTGLFVMSGLILGSIFTNFVYKDYLAYGGQMDSLVLSNKDLYVSSASLFPYILFKRGKQYGIAFLAGYLLQPLVFLYGGMFCMAFFLGSILSLQVIQTGMKGLILVMFSFFPHFLCYGISGTLMFRRNFRDNKKEERLYYEKSSFLCNYSVQFEILFLVLGCIMESFVNPSITSGILKILK